MASFESAVLWDMQRDVRKAISEAGLSEDNVQAMADLVMAAVKPMLRRLFDDNVRAHAEMFSLYDLLPAGLKAGDGYMPAMLRAVEVLIRRDAEFQAERERYNVQVAAER